MGFAYRAATPTMSGLKIRSLKRVEAMLDKVDQVANREVGGACYGGAMRQEVPDADEMKHVQGKRKVHWAPMPAPSGATPE